MSLQRLPIDGIRPILSLLDLTSLARLNATFNLSIQRTLSSAGILPHLRLTSIPSQYSGHLRFLLKTLRNVDCLTFGTGTEWSLRTLSTLLTLNPLKVTLNPGSIHSSAPDLVTRVISYPENYPELVNCVKNLSPSCLPAFALLTPRLTTLHIRCFVYAVSQTIPGMNGYSFPPTLTSFCLDDCRAGQSHPFPDTSYEDETDAYLIPMLPTTLRSLTLRYPVFHFAPLNAIFARFKKLERLELSGAFRVHEPTPLRLSGSGDRFAPVPATLNALHLSSSHWFEDLLRWWRFSESNVSVVDLLMPDQPNHISNYPGLTHFSVQREDKIRDANLSALLPPTVGQLTLSRGFLGSDGPAFVSLPSQSLTSLTVELRKEKDEALWLSAMALPHLRSLVIRPCFACLITMIPWTDDDSPWRSSYSSPSYRLSLNLDPRFLPRTLTHLELPALDKQLTEASIAAMPSGLKTLVVDSMSLLLLSNISTYLPSCNVSMKGTTEFWKDHNMDIADVNHFPEIWSPVFDFHQWSTAVARKLSMLKAGLQLEFSSQADMAFAASPETNTFIWTDSSVPPYAVRFSPLQAFQAMPIMQALPNLTKIVINLPSSRKSIFLRQLPPTVTHLELGTTSLAQPFNLVLPGALRHLSAKGTFTVDRGTPPSLTYLDAPNWSFEPDQLHFKNMEKLCAHVNGVMDFQVVELLTKTIDSKTRSNMSIKLSYFTTGSLIPEVGLQSKLCATWDMITQRTREILQDQLSSPMPSFRPSFGSARPFGTANAFDSKSSNIAEHTAAATPTPTSESATEMVETIGSVVSSLMEAYRPNGIRLCLPKTTSEALIDTGSPWTLTIPKYVPPSLFDSVDATVAEGPRPQVYHSSTPKPVPLTLPAQIVRISFLNVHAPKHWLHCLSSCRHLRYLHISSNSPFIFLVEELPPRLETMALESLWYPAGGVLTGDGGTLSFRLSSLPSTLERLAIVSEKIIHFMPEDDEHATSARLTQLKQVVLSDFSDATSLYSLLPMSTIESLDVISLRDERFIAHSRFSALQNVKWTDWTAHADQTPLGQSAPFRALVNHPLRSQTINNTGAFGFTTQQKTSSDNSQPAALKSSPFGSASSSLTSAFAATKNTVPTTSGALFATSAAKDGIIDNLEQEEQAEKSQSSNPFGASAHSSEASASVAPIPAARKRPVKRR